jgi:hypothetical protein
MPAPPITREGAFSAMSDLIGMMDSALADGS